MASANLHSSLCVTVRAGLEAIADGSNFVFSSLSLHASLALATVVTKGETLDQMLSFLGSPTLDHLNSASISLMALLLASHDDSNGDAGLRLSFVSGVCINRSLLLRPSFRDVITNIYATNVYRAVTKFVNVQDQASTAALCASGSAVIELQLARVPCVVAYRAHLLTEWVIRYRTKLKYISLPNILMNSPIIPEVLFQECTSEKLTTIVRELLLNKAIQEQQIAAAETVLRLLCPSSQNVNSLMFEKVGFIEAVCCPSIVAASNILSAEKLNK